MAEPITINLELLDGLKTITKAFSIPVEDFEPIFGINLREDSVEKANQKIERKLKDETFLFKYMGINPFMFELSEINFGAWQTPVKLKKIDPETGKNCDELTQVVNKKISVKVKRNTKKNVFSDEYIELIMKQWEIHLKDFLKRERIAPYQIFNLQDIADKKHPKSKKIVYNDELAIVSSGVELHLGKLASLSSYEDFDTKKALYRFISIFTKDMVDLQDKYKASTLILGIGNDFFNSDNVNDTTSAGTLQQNDSRFQEMINNGFEAHTYIIKELKKFFPNIILKYQPGNHDNFASFTLYQMLIREFNNDSQITIKNTYKDIRHITGEWFGSNFILFVHGQMPEGKGMNDDTLAATVWKFFPNECSKAEHIIINAGHFHTATDNNFKKKTAKTPNLSLDSSDRSSKVTVNYWPKTAVRRNGSPTGKDHWHVVNGYMFPAIHNVSIYDKEKGPIADQYFIFTSDELKKKVTLNRGEDTDLLIAAHNAFVDATEKIKIDTQKKEYARLEKSKKRITQKNIENLNKILEKLEMNPINPEDLTEEKIYEISLLLNNVDNPMPYIERQKELEEYAGISPKVRKKSN